MKQTLKTNPMKTQGKTFYENWKNQEYGFTGQGSFHTLLLKLYQLADGGNREKLESIYPEYFVDEHGVLFSE